MTRNETFNGQRQFPIAGKYFELVSTVNPVDLVFYTADGEVLSREQQVQQGFVVDRRSPGVEKIEPFAFFEITTGANEAVKFIVSDGLATNRSVPADLTDRAARLVGIVYGTLGQLAQTLIGAINTLWVTLRGFAYGATFSSNANLGAGATVTVVAPGSNVNGVTVWDAKCVTGSAAAQVLALLAKTSAPATSADGDILLVVVAPAAAFSPTGQLAFPVFIPAGKGLYFFSSALETTSVKSVFYTVH